MASTDPPDTNRAFAEKNRANFPILSDPDKSTSAAYGVLSPLGVARRWTFYIGPDGTILKIDRSVTPRTAGEQLLANLQALGVPRIDVPHTEEP